MAKLVRGTGTYWCWGGEGIWRVGSRLGAVLAAEPRLRGEGGAGTYRTCMHRQTLLLELLVKLVGNYNKTTTNPEALMRRVTSCFTKELRRNLQQNGNDAFQLMIG